MSDNNEINKSKLGTIVPLFTSPQINEAAYVQVAGIARRYPRIHTIAVVDINQGPGLGPDPILRDERGIGLLKANGVTVLAYVQTSPSAVNNNLNLIKQQMINWKEWYSNIDGFYFDGAPRVVDDSHINFYNELDNYAKNYLETKFTVVEFDHRMYPTGEGGGGGGEGEVKTVNRHIPRKLVDYTHINLFVIYQGRGFPAPLHVFKSELGEYNNAEEGGFPRSRFVVICSNLSTLQQQQQAQNFVRQVVGTEKIASYVYMHTDSGAREIHPEPYTSLSSIFEPTMITLDQIAVTEDPESARRIQQQQQRQQQEQHPERFLIPTIIGEDRREVVPGESDTAIKDYDRDIYGVQQIYKSAPQRSKAQQWYFMQDRTLEEIEKRDERFRNWSKGIKSNTKTNSISRDESNPNNNYWYFKDIGNGGLIVWSESSNKRFLNTETTIYVFLEKEGVDVGNQGEVFQISARSGIPYDTCQGACYQSIMFVDGRTAVVKKITNSLKTSYRGTQPGTTQTLQGQWIGFKQMVYNLLEDGAAVNTWTVIENWIDENCTDKNGNLVIRNNWRKVTKYIDMGEEGNSWGLPPKSAEEKKLQKMGCESLDMSRKGQKRKSTDVINTPSGNDKDGNCIVFSLSKGTKVKFTNFSVREILPPAQG